MCLGPEDFEGRTRIKGEKLGRDKERKKEERNEERKL